MEEKRKEWWKKLIFPHIVVKILLVIVTVPLLVYSLGCKNANQVIAYFSYGFSAYTLVVVSLKLPSTIKAVKEWLYAHKYSNRYLTDSKLRAEISLYSGTAVNLLYATFYFGMGVYYSSTWIRAIAVYYIVLSVIRVGLVKKDRKKLNIDGMDTRRVYELKSCRTCGKLMFLLNFVVAGIVGHMLWKNEHYNYPGLLIYAQAAYAFFCLTKAIIHLFKYKKMEQPILSAAKIVSMSTALVSILALQTAMLTQFGEGQANFIRLMNALTGTAVCIAEFAMAVWLVHKSRKELELLNEA